MQRFKPFIRKCAALLLLLGIITIAPAEGAERIVSLAPDLTEMLYAIGAGPRVIAVSQDSDYPPAAKALPVVADYRAINVEDIIAMHADLVLAWQGSPAADIALLRKLQVPVVIINNQSLSDIPANLLLLGDLTGQRAQAQTVAAQFSQELHALQQRYAAGKPVRVFLEVADQPLYTLSNQTLQGQVVALCNGANIFAHLSSPAAQVSIESVLAANPEVIVAFSPLSVASWQEWSEIFAVQQHRLYVIDASLIARATPRIIRGAEQICAWIQRAR